ncbi:MAG: bifunctional transaldolase/phosoglucose isomerase [Nitrospirae bacterium]|nr:bifunctional transaldolase/phosoglucose isomerase [Nitrospirota bacterium]
MAANRGWVRTLRHARQEVVLPGSLGNVVSAAVDAWAAEGKLKRLWERDATLWTGRDESEWLGWLGIVHDQLQRVDELTRFAGELGGEGFGHVVLLGMGGSSLCPEVLKRTFGRIAGHPELHVLDSTDPAQVLALERVVDLSRTLFIVSSKSGSTLEPNIFEQYFFERAKQVVGAERAGHRFIAITDPGSRMQKVAEQSRFRRVFHGIPSIGGRFSALSDFGIVPAAVMGLNVRRLLERTADMVRLCSADVLPVDNPGVLLGAVLGAGALQGRDKVTLVASPGVAGLGAWLEQLLAESTGKVGKGLIPVDLEGLGPPEAYGDDRLLAYLRLEQAPDPAQDRAVEALERAGHAVVRIGIADTYDLGREFFRWELATAVAGSIIGINPFDQPDVEASKVATLALMAESAKSGRLPSETPLIEEDGTRLYADEANATAIRSAVDVRNTFEGWIRAHLDRLRPRDYFALLAYVEMKDDHFGALQNIRHAVRDRWRVATCVGFGPRFLHSTGQAYKGGPNTGVFLQVTCDDAVDLPVPGEPYTFGAVKAAQARGDLTVLAERGRRVLRVHLGKDVQTGLRRLSEAVRAALA